MYLTMFTTLLFALFGVFTVTSALPTTELEEGTISLESRFLMAVPRCHALPTFPKFCILGSYQNEGQDYASLSVFNHNCKMIGFDGSVPTIGTFGLDSQLPYVCVVTLFDGNTGCPGDTHADACGVFGYQRQTPVLSYDGTTYDTTSCYAAGDDDAKGTYCMTEFEC